MKCEIHRLSEETRKVVINPAATLHGMEKRLDDSMRKAVQWRGLRDDSIISNRLPEVEPPAPFGDEPGGVDQWDDLMKQLSFGLKWEEQRYVPKRRRIDPPAAEGSALEPILPCPSLVYELKCISRDSEWVLDFINGFTSLIDLVAPKVEEGASMPIVLSKVKARLLPMKAPLRSLQTIYLDYLACRGVCEEQYYKNHLTSDWTEVLDTFDNGSWHKVIRARRLFVRVIAFTSAVYQKNAKNLEEQFTSVDKTDRALLS